MAAPIGPGDFVECIMQDDQFPEMRPGSIWCIEAILPDPGFGCENSRECREPSLKFTAHPDDNWCACAYRPIYRPRADLIESLKAPPKVAPVRESEDA